MPYRLNPFTNNFDFFEEESGGGGDVNGPSSAVNNNFAAFDGTTGKLIKDAGVSASSFLQAPATPATLPSQYLEYNGSSLSYFNWLQEVKFVDDFLGANLALPYWRTSTQNGGDANIPVSIDSGHPGIMQLTTNTATNGASFIILGTPNSSTNNNFILGGGSLDIYWVFQLSALSDGTDTYQVSIGLGDTFNTPTTSFDNGVFFNYSSTINSGNWQGSTSSSSSKSIVNSSVAATTNFTTLRMNINAAATLCTFYVNGTSVGTISTNIPTTRVSPCAVIAKSAGTSTRNLNLDLMYLYQSLTNPR
jgi:hypothetical protein